jgi:LAO/AO transport system ATPase
MIAALVAQLRQGDRNALARLVSHAARSEHLSEIQSALGSSSSPARVVAITGSGGVGKSTLIGKLIPHVRSQNHRVAVLACDPESPLSGGALLGDRFRMGSSTDDGVFIRSLATPGGRGAVADHLDVMIRLLEAYGFDVVFLETVGSGQGDVEVRNLADVVALLLQPESGDDVQWEKAGILECADLVVVHKADLPSADQTAAQVRAALDLSMGRQVPVLLASSKANQGYAELWQAIEAMPLRRGRASAAGAFLKAARARLEERLRANGELVSAWQRGNLSIDDALRKLLSEPEA